jgi:hypothetical protein
MSEKVKCANCGFLAVRMVSTRLLVDAERETRKTGDLPSHGNHYIYEEFPVCFVQATDFVAEMGVPGRDARHSAIQRDRECAAFTKWFQGFTPREHQEMIDRQWMLEYQRDRERDDRSWRKKEFWIIGIGIPLAVLVGTVIAQLAAAFIQRGDWFGAASPPASSSAALPVAK